MAKDIWSEFENFRGTAGKIGKEIAKLEPELDRFRYDEVIPNRQNIERLLSPVLNAIDTLSKASGQFEKDVMPKAGLPAKQKQDIQRRMIDTENSLSNLKSKLSEVYNNPVSIGREMPEITRLMDTANANNRFIGFEIRSGRQFLQSTGADKKAEQDTKARHENNLNEIAKEARKIAGMPEAESSVPDQKTRT